MNSISQNIKEKNKNKEDKMKTLLVASLLVLAGLTVDLPGNLTFPGNPFKTEVAEASIRWVNSSRCSNGGYFRDTSNDGNSFNNANTLGFND